MGVVGGHKRGSLVVPINTDTGLTIAHHQRVLDVTAGVGGDVTITVPAAGSLPDGFECVVRRNAASANDVILATGVSRTLTEDAEGVILVADSGGWIYYPTIGPTGAAGPNQITGSTTTTLSGTLRGDGANVSATKDNLSATSAPTTGDDSNDGYAVGSRWMDVTGDKEYVCLDATVGAAVWKETSVPASDFLSALVNSEVTINGATTATIGKMHLITDSGTPADYTIALPAVSGNAGKFIGFRVSNAATKFFTIDPDGTEKIWTKRGEVSTRVYVRGETAILQCDGTRWHVLYETMLEVGFMAYQDSANSINSGSGQKVNVNIESWDIDGCYDNATNYRFQPLAPGIYRVGGVVSLSGLGANKQIWIAFKKNGTTYIWPLAQTVSVSLDPNVTAEIEYSMNGTTDYIELFIYHDHGSALNTSLSSSGGQAPRFWASRIRRETS